MVNISHLIAALVGVGGALAASDDRSVVVVALRHDPAKLAALAVVLDDVSNPRSARYGQWLTSDSVSGFLAAPKDQVARVLSWLEHEAAECRATGDQTVRGSLTFAVVGQVCGSCLVPLWLHDDRTIKLLLLENNHSHPNVARSAGRPAP